MGHQVAVLSHTYWQRRFAGEPTVIGRAITLGGLPFTVVGVTPAEFFGAEVGTSPSLYLPVMMQPALLPMNGSLLERPNVFATWLRVLGRLKPGVPLEQAGPRLNALAGTPETEWRPRNKFTGQFEDARLVVSSAAAGLSDLRRQFSQPLFVLLGVAGLVLLIACANVGQLVLARSAARRSEFALRLALGASRGRVMRQVLVEGLVLTGIGAAAGVALAYWAAPALVQFASAGQGPWCWISHRIFGCWRSPPWCRSPPGCSSPALRRFAPRAPTCRLTGRAISAARDLRVPSLDPAKPSSSSRWRCRWSHSSAPACSYGRCRI